VYLSHREKFELPLTVIVCVKNSETFAVINLLLDAQRAKKLELRGILMEKPLGTQPQDALNVTTSLVDEQISAYVAFNRRFYPAVQYLKGVIEEDGGAEYVHFEFNEWEERFEIASSVLSTQDIKNWQFTNGCHVIDTAFYLAGGTPLNVQAISTAGNCSKCENFPTAAAFGGSAVTTHGTAVTWKSYFRCKSPWMIEVVTSKRVKYQLNPLEKLVRIRPGHTEPEVLVPFISLANQVRPGLHEMLDAFLNNLKGGDVPRSSQLVHVSEYQFLLEKVYMKICAPPRLNVVVIGGGNISYRYIQGLLKEQQLPYVHVSEPSKLQQMKLLSNLTQDDANATSTYVSIFSNPTPYFIPRHADILLSATTADVRFSSLMDMLNRIQRVECIILEKPTFTLLAHWEQFLEFSEKKQISVYSAAGGCTLFSEPITSLIKWKHMHPAHTIRVCVRGSS